MTTVQTLDEITSTGDSYKHTYILKVLEKNFRHITFRHQIKKFLITFRLQDTKGNEINLEFWSNANLDSSDYFDFFEIYSWYHFENMKIVLDSFPTGQFKFTWTNDCVIVKLGNNPNERMDSNSLNEEKIKEENDTAKEEEEAEEEKPPNNKTTANNQVNNKTLDCVVCMENNRSVLFMPCKHVACCLSCSKQVLACPLCRVAIDETIQVYL